MKLIFLFSIILVAGFFALNGSNKTINLSTQTKNNGGVIIKANENKGFLDFLASAFTKSGSLETGPKQPAKTADMDRGKQTGILDLGKILNSINPLGNLGASITTNSPKQIVADIATNAPKEEPAKSLYIYFVSSSHISFEQEYINSAVRKATEGNKTALEKVIAGYEGRLEAFRQIEPPPLAIAIHEQSAALIENYIFILKRMVSADKEETKNIWLSKERENINIEANEIIEQIRELEQQYNFTLPKEVLPAN